MNPQPRHHALTRRRLLLAAGLAAVLPCAIAAPPIEAVVLHRGHGMGYGGAITVAYRARVLYADGSYTADAKQALGDSPRVDGRWQRDGGGYLLQPTRAGSKPERIGPKMKARPAPRGATLQGEYRSLSGVGSPGTGLSYSFANGVLSVVAGGGTSNNPTNITLSVSGSTLTLSWPQSHLGWILQTQTNSLSTGLTAAWHDVVGTGSSTQAVLTIDKTHPTRFFRLRHP